MLRFHLRERCARKQPAECGFLFFGVRNVVFALNERIIAA